MGRHTYVPNGQAHLRQIFGVKWSALLAHGGNKMSTNLRIELKMIYQDKAFGAALEFDEERRNTKCVSYDAWHLMFNGIRTLQKNGILDECYFWLNDLQVEQIASTSSGEGNDTVSSPP